MPEQLNQRESARLTALLFLFVSHGSPTQVRDRLPTGDATHNLRETFSQGLTEGLTEALADSLRQRPFGPRKHTTPDHARPLPDHHLPPLVAQGAGRGAHEDGNGAGVRC